MPTTEQLLLDACLAESHQFGRALHAFDQNADLDDLNSGTLRLVPYLYRKIERHQAVSTRQGILKGIYTRYWYLHTMSLRPALETVCGLLPGRFLLLKGMALQHLIYDGDPATRPSDDIDILVRTDDRQNCLSLLEEHGFTSDSSISTKAALQIKPSVSLVRGAERIDLHWVLYPTSIRGGIVDELFQNAIPLNVGGHEVMTLSPTHHLIHNLMHGFAPNEVSAIRWILDCALLSKNPDVDWSHFVNSSRAWGWHKSVLAQALTLRDAYAVALPNWVLSSLSDANESTRSKMLRFHRKQGPGVRRKFTSTLISQTLNYQENNRTRLVASLIRSLQEWSSNKLIEVKNTRRRQQ